MKTHAGHEASRNPRTLRKGLLGAVAGRSARAWTNQANALMVQASELGG